MGLLPGHSITIDVPLVFWDAGRIIITTDGADLLGTGPNGNPFLYRDQSTQVTYYGTVSGNTLTFTPVYKSFVFNSANNDYEPSTATMDAARGFDNRNDGERHGHSRQHDHHRGE